MLRALMPLSLQPHARFIVSLREPADRMLSWYNHKRRQRYQVKTAASVPNSFCILEGGRANGQAAGHVQPDGSFFPSFDEAAACRLVEWERMSEAHRNDILPETTSIRGNIYSNPLTTGHYSTYLRMWINGGWRRSQFLVLSFSELTRPGSDALTRVRAFAGVAPFAVDGLPKENAAGLMNENPGATQRRMCCATWEQLKAHFAAPNRELYAQLAEDRRTAAAPPEERPFEPFDEEKECTPCAS